MADFDRGEAAQRHERIIRRVQQIREEDAETRREGIRRYLRIAVSDINNLLDGDLN